MYKAFQYYTPFTSIFTSYPSLMAPPAPTASTRIQPLTPSQIKAINDIGKSVRATKYDDRNEQRVFLDEKTLAYEAFLGHIEELAAQPSLFDIAFHIKNSYHQSASHTGGVIAGRYPTIVDICNRLKSEKDRAKNAFLQSQQVHRAELEDARAYKESLDAEAKAARDEAKAAKEAARAAKEAATAAKETVTRKRTRSFVRTQKRVKSKATVDDVDEEASVFDDADFPVDGSGEQDDPMLIDGPEITPTVPTQGHRRTRSLDERNSAIVREAHQLTRVAEECLRQLNRLDRERQLRAVSVLPLLCPFFEKLTQAQREAGLKKIFPQPPESDSDETLKWLTKIRTSNSWLQNWQSIMTLLSKQLHQLGTPSKDLPSQALLALSVLRNPSFDHASRSLMRNCDTILNTGSIFSEISSVFSTLSTTEVEDLLDISRNKAELGLLTSSSKHNTVLR
ncbi:hypothetical protein C8R43DRAFT_961977 [Mycena crocata]|nr:hypothetical protein C8R43DRAFT_961977 [Mycena crocata]